MVALILLILWPIAELLVIVKLAEAIGVLLTLVLLVLSWPFGMWVLRTHSRGLRQRALRGLAMGQLPGREAVDAVLVMLAGLLFLIPGFITDATGLLLLLPPSRALFRRVLARHRHRRFIQAAARFAQSRRTYDVDATAHDLQPPHLRP